jgi:SAM-dependent methyltransferase
MRFLKYTRYFFYIAYNWNLRIAMHIIKNETRGEKQYGIDTTGADELESLEKKGIDTSHATIYMPASYDLIEEILSKLKTGGLTHFVDIGSGKGRAMIVAAHYGFTRITGIDFSKELCQAALRNIEKVKPRFPSIDFKVINNDAFYYEFPKDADCIFLFNPFDETIMSGVLKNIERHRKGIAKDIFIIYLNPVQKHLFLKQGYKEIYHTKKLNYLEGSILQKKG